MLDCIASGPTYSSSQVVGPAVGYVDLETRVGNQVRSYRISLFPAREAISQLGAVGVQASTALRAAAGQKPPKAASLLIPVGNHNLVGRYCAGIAISYARCQRKSEACSQRHTLGRQRNVRAGTGGIARNHKDSYWCIRSYSGSRSFAVYLEVAGRGVEIANRDIAQGGRRALYACGVGSRC